MSERIRCYYLKHTPLYRKSLRRYRGSDQTGGVCALDHGYHDASNVIIKEFMPLQKPTSGDLPDDVPHSDPRWPIACACGYAFVEDDDWQVSYEPLYQRSDTNVYVTLHEATPGAIWDATWMPERYKGPDGRCFVCVLPNGSHWMIDDKCSNCTRPNEPHQCWVRHGEPPDLHVDKDGNTCSAGAGSIISGKDERQWHGFLHHGYLVTA